MAEKCVKCGADTILRVNGVPLCVDCDNKTMHAEQPRRSPQSESENDGKKLASAQ